MLHTLPWFWQAQSFLVPLRHWENTPDTVLGETGRSALCSGGMVDWKEITAATSPAAHWLYAWFLCPGINSPGEPASLLNLNVLEHWSNYQVATWGFSRSPREVNLAGNRLGARLQHSPPGGPGKPTQRRAQFPEKPTPASDPRHLSTDAQTQARSFQTEARPGLHPGLHIPVHRVQSGLNVLTAKSTQSCLNIISVDRTWRGLNLPCRQNLVRFKLV